jgi:hypothetical protein
MKFLWYGLDVYFYLRNVLQFFKKLKSESFKKTG